MAQRLAIIGGDAAGMSAASQARRRDPSLDIVAFERGPYTSYSACGIPYYIGRDFTDSERLIVRGPEEHRERGIDVRIRHEVTAIDLHARELTVVDHNDRQERTEPFDQLVIATGAVAVGPKVPGMEAVEPARTVDAAERFHASLVRGGEHAVVIGAGYIGLEMAEALVKRGLDVTMIDVADQVMPIALDADMASHVQDGAESEGIKIRLATPVEAIERDDDGRPVAVRTADGLLRADHVVVATGVKPETKIAADAGLEIGEHGGLRVDDHQRCSADGVFAAGDCVETWHRLLERHLKVQLGTHANKQGRVAGVNATGGDAAFPGVLGTAVSRICSREVARTGLTEDEVAALTDLDVVAATIRSTTRAGYFPGSGPMWVKLLCERATGRLLGGQIVGTEGAAKRVDVLATAIWAGMTVEEFELVDLGYAPPVSPVYDPLLTAASALVRKRAGS